MKRGKESKKKGFTLIELIVVLAIIGILATILVPTFMGYTDKAKITKAKAEAKTVLNALNAYDADKEGDDVKNTWTEIEGVGADKAEAKKFIKTDIDPTLAAKTRDELQAIVDKQLKAEEAKTYIDGK